MDTDDFITIAPLSRAYLRKLTDSGGRLFVETDADRRHVRALLPLGLVGPSGGDRRAIEITNKGRDYLLRLARAH